MEILRATPLTERAMPGDTGVDVVMLLLIISLTFNLVMFHCVCSSNLLHVQGKNCGHVSSQHARLSMKPTTSPSTERECTVQTSVQL